MKKTTLFKLSRMINKMELKEIKGNTQGEIGMNLITTIVSNLCKAENEADDFLASYLDKAITEVRDLDAVEYLEAFEAALKDESLVSFFKRSLAGLAKPKNEI